MRLVFTLASSSGEFQSQSLVEALGTLLASPEAAVFGFEIITPIQRFGELYIPSNTLKYRNIEMYSLY